MEERNLHEPEWLTRLRLFFDLMSLPIEEQAKFILWVSYIEPKDLYFFEEYKGYGRNFIELDDFEAIIFDEDHTDPYQNNDLDDWL